MTNNKIGRWEPYFKPTTRKHDSGFGCFECGYLQMDGGNPKVIKKVVIARGVDHITNLDFYNLVGRGCSGTTLNLDLLQDGYIRIFNLEKPLYWNIPGFSDAFIVDNRRESAYPDYDDLDELWESMNNKMKGETK